MSTGGLARGTAIDDERNRSVLNAGLVRAPVIGGEMGSRVFDAIAMAYSTIIYIGYLMLGLLQMAATMAGFQIWLGLHWFIAGTAALFLGPVPFVGAALGMVGAVKAWRWGWVDAAILFFGPTLLFGILLLVGGAVSVAARRHQ